MPVPLAHESASNAGGSARSPPLGRQAGHARRGRARRTLHSSPRPWGAYPHRPPLSRRHCDTRRTSRLSRSGGREAGWLGMSQALGLSAPLRVHSPLPPPPPPGHQREGATSLKRLAAGISPQSAGPEASPRGLGVGGRARTQPGGPQWRRPQPLPAASSPSVPAPMESVARAAHVADTPTRLLNGPPKVRRPRWAGALHGDPSHAPRERFSLLSPPLGQGPRGRGASGLGLVHLRRARK